MFSFSFSRCGASRAHLLATTIVSGVVAPLACHTAVAQPTTAQPTTALPPITIVTSPTAVPTPVDQVASSITVITAADIGAEIPLIPLRLGAPYVAVSSSTGEFTIEP